MTTAQTQGQILPYRTMMMKTAPALPLVNDLLIAAIKLVVAHARSPGEQSALSLMFPGDLELDALFEDHGVCFAVDEGMLTLERAVYQRCTREQLLFFRQTEDQQAAMRSLLGRSRCRRCSPAPHCRFPSPTFWTSLIRGPQKVPTTMTSSTSSPWLPPVYMFILFILTDLGWAHQPRYPRRFPNCLLQPHNSSPGANPTTPQRCMQCGQFSKSHARSSTWRS